MSWRVPRFAAISLLGALVACGATTDDPSADLYDPEQLNAFTLTLPPASVEALKGQCKLTDRPYVPADFAFGNERLTRVGVHLKGEYSCRELDSKPSLKVKFDAFVPNQSFRGLRRMTWNAAIQDRSFVAERLSYHLYRSAGLPAPRANGALVTINGTFYGVYVNVETEDKTFLRRWFSNVEGNLYEEGRSDLVRGSESQWDLETNEASNDRSDLTRLIATIDGAKDATYLDDLGAAIDIPQFLRFTALEGLVNQWDMYTYTYFIINNFRLYGEPGSRRFHFIPWGIDHSWKPNLRDGTAHIPLFSQSDKGGRIMRRCFALPTCKARYVTVMEEMVAHLESAGLEALANRWYAALRPHIAMDTRKGFDVASSERVFTQVLETIRGKVAFARTEIRKAGGK